MWKKNKNVKKLTANCGHYKKIYWDNFRSMIFQECLPSLTGCSAVLLWNVSHDSRFRNIKTKFRDFSMSPWNSPLRIIFSHLLNKIDLFLWEPRPASAMTAPPDPVYFKSFPTAIYNWFWFYDYHTSRPVTGNARHNCKEKPVRIPNLKSLVWPNKDFELLPEKDNF